MAFAASLSVLDELYLLPIYPARELPIEGVNSEMVLNLMKGEAKSIKNEEEVLLWVEGKKELNKKEVIVIAGAGNIDQLPEKIKEVLKK